MAVNPAVLDATIRHAVFLEKLKAGEVGKFAPFLKEIDRSIRDRLTQSDLTEYSVKRLEALLKEVDSLLLGIFDRYSAQLNLDLVDIANYEAEFEATSIARSAPVGVSLDVVAPTAAAIRTAVLTNPLSVRGNGGGKLLKAFIKGWTSAERERVTGTIRQGFFEGQTNFQIIRNIRGTKAAGYKDGILATTSRNASTVVHTAIQHVSSQARMEVAKANTDIVQEIQMVATLDSKTSQLCRSMDGRRFPVESGPRPPFHPNCLPGHTLVTASSGIAGVSKRWFDGEVVVFKTSSGRVLTCTPNHPILTDKGWVAAKELDLRSNVICDGSSKWAGVVDCDDHDMPSSIHEVTEAFLSNSSVLACPVPVSAPYFHGDGVGSEVAVIGADRVLGGGVYAAIHQHRKELGLVPGDARRSGLISNRALSFLFRAVDSTSCSFVSSLSKALSLVRSCCSHARTLLLTSVSSRNTCQLEMPDDDIWGDLEISSYTGDSDAGIEHFNQSFGRQFDFRPSGVTHDDASLTEGSIEYGSADTELAANIINGCSGHVFCDQIVEIRNDGFSGHVYNLETVEGWYFAGGIVTHNCRTTFVLLTSLSEIFAKGATRASVGANGGQQVSADLDYYHWLQQQPASFQDVAIGPVRAKLFREGGLTIERFTELQLDRNFAPLTLAQMKGLEPLAFERAGI